MTTFFVAVLGMGALAGWLAPHVIVAMLTTPMVLAAAVLYGPGGVLLTFVTAAGAIAAHQSAFLVGAACACAAKERRFRRIQAERDEIDRAIRDLAQASAAMRHVEPLSPAPNISQAAGESSRVA